MPHDKPNDDGTRRDDYRVSPTRPTATFRRRPSEKATVSTTRRSGLMIAWNRCPLYEDFGVITTRIPPTAGQPINVTAPFDGPRTRFGGDGHGATYTIDTSNRRTTTCAHRSRSTPHTPPQTHPADRERSAVFIVPMMTTLRRGMNQPGKLARLLHELSRPVPLP